ncbi:MAG: type II secretion system protein [Armatimonadetes bacterium]|nr:MAG: type II secretion system protein [Armatimonadota bacterium]
MRRQSALTLVESLVVLAIIAIVAVLLTPVFLRAKDAAKVRTSVSGLRQMWTALELYRNDWGGADVFDGPSAYYRLGLPEPSEGDVFAPYGVTPALWQSPCGADPTIFSTGPTFVRGWYSFAPHFFSPSAMSSIGNATTYGNYIQTYRQNLVTFLDPYCNPAGTSMMSARTKKRGLSVLLSGQALNRRKEGNAFFLQWWSDPPN